MLRLACEEPLADGVYIKTPAMVAEDGSRHLVVTTSIHDVPDDLVIAVGDRVITHYEYGERESGLQVNNGPSYRLLPKLDPVAREARLCVIGMRAAETTETTGKEARLAEQ